MCPYKYRKGDAMKNVHVALAVVLSLAAVTFVPSKAHAAGGQFSAAFSGRIVELSCNPFSGGQFRFSGAGRASFFGRRSKFATENGGLSGTYHVFGCNAWMGGTIFAIGNPAIGSIDFSLSSNNITKGCVRGAQFTVTGGTGKFVNAAGSGTVAFSCSGNTYTDQWSGTITF
jgi:hypothetical protein